MTLVPLAARHLERTRAWMNDPEVARLLGRSGPVSAQEHRLWSAALASRTDCLYLAIETNATAAHIGNIWLWAIDQRHAKAELRIAIGDSAHQGRGAGTEAIDLLTRHAFEVLGLHRVYAHVLAFNPHALRAFQKAGFRLEGTLREDRVSAGDRVDVHVLGRLRSDGGSA